MNDLTTSDGTFISGPFTVDQGEQSSVIQTDTNVRTCANPACTVQQSTYTVSDVLITNIAPNDEVPPGYRLGTVLEMRLNDIVKPIIEQGRNSDGTLWASILIDTVCEECILNVTASVVKVTTVVPSRSLLQAGHRLRSSAPASISSISVIKTEPKTMSPIVLIIGSASGGFMLLVVGVFGYRYIKRRNARRIVV